MKKVEWRRKRRKREAGERKKRWGEGRALHRAGLHPIPSNPLCGSELTCVALKRKQAACGDRLLKN